MKVLLVDDEIFTIRMIQNLIHWEEMGLEYIGYAQNGRDAYEMVLRDIPDIIISDIRMPEMDGLEFMRKVSDFSANIRIIVMSAYADFSFVQEAMKIGCSDYILKPVDEMELEKALRKVTAKILGEREQQKVISKSVEELNRNYLYHFMKTGQGLNKLLKTGQKYLMEEQEYRLLMLRINNDTIDEYDNSTNMEMAQEGYVLQMLNTVLDRDKKEYVVFGIDEGCWTVILGETCEKIEDAAKTLILNLREETGFLFQICFSSKGKGMRQLPMLFHEVKNLSKYGFYVGDEDILGYGYNCNKRELDVVRDIGIEKEIDQAVKNQEPEKLFGILDEIFEFSKGHYPEKINRIHELCYQMVLAIRKDMIKESHEAAYKQMLNEMTYHDIAAISSMKELEMKMTEILEQIADQRKDSVNISYSKPVKKCISIIEDNYKKNLSLEEICNEVAVSKNYFCYLFKRETGISLWSYLTNVRMQHAKKLLEDTDLKNYEVAFTVGYDNPSYFSRLFKKYENMTPNEYRESKK